MAFRDEEDLEAIINEGLEQIEPRFLDEKFEVLPYVVRLLGETQLTRGRAGTLTSEDQKERTMMFLEQQERVVDDLLQKVIDSRFQAFTDSLVNFGRIGEKFSTSQDALQVLRSKVNESKSLLTTRKDHLRHLWLQTMQSKEAVKILDMIDELQQIPNYVKQLKQEKSFVQAVSLLYHARQKTFQEEMLNLPFMDEIRESIFQEQNEILETIYEELMNYVFFKVNESDPNWQRRLAHLREVIHGEEKTVDRKSKKETRNTKAASRLSSLRSDDRFSDDKRTSATSDWSDWDDDFTSTKDLRNSRSTSIRSAVTSVTRDSRHESIRQTIRQRGGSVGAYEASMNDEQILSVSVSEEEEKMMDRSSLDPRLYIRLLLLALRRQDALQSSMEQLRDSSKSCFEALIQRRTAEIHNELWHVHNISSVVSLDASASSVAIKTRGKYLREVTSMLLESLFSNLQRHAFLDKALIKASKSYTLARLQVEVENDTQMETQTEGANLYNISIAWQVLQQQLYDWIKLFLPDSTVELPAVSPVFAAFPSRQSIINTSSTTKLLSFSFDDSTSVALKDVEAPKETRKNEKRKSRYKKNKNDSVYDSLHDLIPPNHHYIIYLWRPLTQFIDQAQALMKGTEYSGSNSYIRQKLNEYIRSTLIPKIRSEALLDIFSERRLSDSFQVENVSCAPGFPKTQPVIRLVVAAVNTINRLSEDMMETRHFVDDYANVLIALIDRVIETVKTRFQEMTPSKESVQRLTQTIVISGTQTKQYKEILTKDSALRECLQCIKSDYGMPSSLENQIKGNSKSQILGWQDSSTDSHRRASLAEILEEFQNEQEQAESTLYDLNFANSHLQRENLIMDASLIGSLALIASSLEWFARSLELLSWYQGNYSNIPVSFGSSVRQPIQAQTSSHLQELRKYVDTIADMALNYFFVIRTELRLQIFYNLSKFSQRDYWLDAEAMEPEEFVLDLNHQLLRVEEQLAANLTMPFSRYILAGLPKLVGDIMLRVPRFIMGRRMNKYGGEKMARNAFALQQNFTNIVALSDNDYSQVFDSIRIYFQLINQKDADVIGFAQANRHFFAYSDFLELLEISSTVQRSPETKQRMADILRG